MVDSGHAYRQAAARGAVAGLGASVVQTLVGLALDGLLLPKREHNNIAPRFVKRLANWTGRGGDARRDWTFGTLFHLGYGVGWGVLLSLSRRVFGLPAVPQGALTGGAIYAAAFSPIGAGTVTRTEPPPERRGWHKELSLVAVAWSYAYAAAMLDELLRRWRLFGAS